MLARNFGNPSLYSQALERYQRTPSLHHAPASWANNLYQREGRLPPYRVPADAQVEPGVYATTDANGNNGCRVVDRTIPDYSVFKISNLLDPPNETLASYLPKKGRTFVVLDPSVS